MWILGYLAILFANKNLVVYAFIVAEFGLLIVQGLWPQDVGKVGTGFGWVFTISCVGSAFFGGLLEYYL